MNEHAESGELQAQGKCRDAQTWLSIVHVNTLCERLLSLFIFVAATFLLAAP
jgi:hypothetical protein